MVKAYGLELGQHVDNYFDNQNLLAPNAQAINTVNIEMKLDF